MWWLSRPTSLPRFGLTENAMPTVWFTVVGIRLGLCVSACGRQLTVVVVEHVRPVDSDHGLSTWGIGVSIGTVYKGAAAVDQVLAVLIEKGTTSARGASDTDTVPGGCQSNSLRGICVDPLTPVLQWATCPGSSCNIFHG